MNIEQRAQQILEAVDNLKRVHDAWEADQTAPVQPTAHFEETITLAIDMADEGDIPGHCRDLCVALQRLGLEWDYYVHGRRTPDHRPIGSFWGAFRAVLVAREGAEPQPCKRPEPVFLLIEQRVPHHQIAHHIWGYKGKGPFVNAAGQVDSTKIMEEAKEPGKYTRDWTHPEQIERQRERQRELSRRLGSISRRETGDTPTVEKATVVEMLKEGQYPDVIARVKRVSVEDVLDEARRYSISPAVRPNLASERAPHEPPILGSEPDLTSPISLEAPVNSVDDFGAEELDQDDAEPPLSDEDLIRSLSDGQRGTAEIVAAAREQGRKLSFQQVKAALKPARVK